MPWKSFVGDVVRASRSTDQYPFAFISGTELLQLAREHAVTPWQAQQLVLEKGINLERYLRNYSSIDLHMQLALARSKVLMVGAGGLGGYVLEILARLGVGTFLAADGDTFEESNLNRQLLGTMASLKKSKLDAAMDRVQLINPFTRLELFPEFLQAADLPDLLSRVDLVLDCLGGILFRNTLLKAAHEAGRPLVTGFVAGQTGLACTVYPGDRSPESFWQGSLEQGAEQVLGTLSTIVGLIASIQSHEAVAIVTRNQPGLRNKVFLADLDKCFFQTLDL